MKRFICSIFLLALAVAPLAADPEEPAVQLMKLQDRRVKVLKEMVSMREKLIRQDPRLKELHDQIMNLHRQLAVQLDGKREMKNLQDELIEVEDAIRRLTIQSKRAEQKK